MCEDMLAPSSEFPHAFRWSAFCLLPSPRSYWAKQDRVAADYVHEVTVAVHQQNLDKLEAALLDVSTPGSRNFRKHWTTEQVRHVRALVPSAVQRACVVCRARASTPPSSLSRDADTSHPALFLWDFWGGPRRHRRAQVREATMGDGADAAATVEWLVTDVGAKITRSTKASEFVRASASVAQWEAALGCEVRDARATRHVHACFCTTPLPTRRRSRQIWRRGA